MFTSKVTCPLGGEEGRGKDGGDRAVQSSPQGDREAEWHSGPHSV